MFRIFPLLLLAHAAFAQDAYHTGLVAQFQTSNGLSNGQWVLPNTETATFGNASGYGATVTDFAVSGLPFAQARRFQVAGGLGAPWNAGHLYKNISAVAPGDKCLMVFWLRSPTPEAQVNIFAENSTTYAKEFFAAILLTDQWQQYLIPFECTANYAPNALNIGLHLAWTAQTIEVGGVAVLNYKNNFPLAQLPIELHNDTYPGQAPNAPWRAEAAASIEQIRKANLNVQVFDNQGNPLPNAVVEVEMQQHEFKFGTAVISNRFGGGNAQDNTYEQKLLNLDGQGHGFNEVVFENDLKWPAWEQHWYSSQPEIAAAAQWLLDRDISIRGHNLVWPSWVYSPPDLEPNQNNPNYLKTRIRNHLDHILTYPGVGAACADWDVLNEITANTQYADALAGTPGYATGRELYGEIFRQADSLVPNATLYLNDYVAIERGQQDDGSMAIWRSRIDELVAAAAPLEGIGFQGHFGAFPTGIPRVKTILDDFYAAYGLEAKVTEYDIDKLVPAPTQADYMRDILTICYAHPSMKGFLMWGFWDGAHWLGNAPIFNQDWTLKPSGAAFVDQIFNQWWTDETRSTDAAGQTSLRGFRGKYRVRARCGDLVQEQELMLNEDKTLIFNLNCTVGTGGPAAALIFEVRPNPRREQVALTWESPRAPTALRICDVAGRVVANCAAPAGQSQVFSTAGWPPGLYFATASFEGRPLTRKFSVAHR
jgi:endo-1,4-beta-xylanase